MTIKQLGRALRDMYDHAPVGDKKTTIHLFAIRYADELKNVPAKDVAVAAELPISYHTEISAGRRLARYVMEKDHQLI